MNYNLPFIPERSKKPRSKGLTMVMDKGLSIGESKNLIDSCSELIDYVKLGFGTSAITNKLQEKLKLYRRAGIRPYFGGTLFEAFVIRNMFDEYRRIIDKYKLDVVEISDGSMYLPHEKKLEYIRILSKQATVISEVGSKDKGVIIPPESWAQMMKTELEAGSHKVIAEARESGTIGIYHSDGSADEELIKVISSQVKESDVIWEAPEGKQQVWFIKLFGPEVNLGNIAPNIVIPLECLRLGLRGDTFLDFLPEDIKIHK
jgi:phosphosulfolactate synthase